MPLFAGIEIGGTKLQLVVGDEAGKIIQRLKFAVEPAKGAAAIREQIQRAMPDLTRANNIESVGVGFGGPVDWRSGRIDWIAAGPRWNRAARVGRWML